MKGCIRKVGLFYVHPSLGPVYMSSLSVLDTLMALNVNVILGERLDMQSTALDGEFLKLTERGQRVVKTVQGREVVADLIVRLFQL